MRRIVFHILIIFLIARVGDVDAMLAAIAIVAQRPQHRQPLATRAQLH